MLYMPLSLHFPCLTAILRDRDPPQWLSDNIVTARGRMMSITTAQAVAARTCNDSCFLCQPTLDHDAKWQKQMTPTVTSGLHPGLPAPKRSKRGSINKPVDAVLTTSDLTAWTSSTGGSIRSTARGADTQRKRKREGDTSIGSVSGSVHRRDSTRLNKCFSRLFHDTDCQYGKTDGGAVVCVNLMVLICVICWLRGELVSQLYRVKLNMDGGRGSLKLMLQLLFKDNEIFQGGGARARRRGGLADNGGMLDNGAKRTFIIGLIHGASETFASVRFLFDRYSFRDLREMLPADCQIICPVDMKMGALFAGVESSGSRHPQPNTMFSMYQTHSQPHIFRTAESIMDMLTRRRQAEEKRGRPFATGIDYGSVGAPPIRLLQELFWQTPIADCLVPPQLHLLLGIVKTLLLWVETLDKALLERYLRKIGVVRNVKHGREDFQGNECRKILRLSKQISDLLPERHRLPVRDEDVADTIVDLRVSSDEYKLTLLRLLVDLFGSFSSVVSTTMGSMLRDQWQASLERFDRLRQNFVVFFNARYPVRGARRDELRLTMKLECLRREVPRRILATDLSLLADSEQGNESVHFYYQELEARYKIPHTETGNRQEDLKETSPEKENIFGNTRSAREKRLQSVLAWNFRCLALSSVVQARIDQLQRWKCTCSIETLARLDFPDPYSTDRDHSRGGEDLRVCGCCPYNPGPQSQVCFRNIKLS